MKRALIVVALVMFSLPALAQFVAPGGQIPVVANNPGLNGTYWRSDVSVLNTTDIDGTIMLILFPEIINGVADFEMIISDEISVPANSQITLTNIVQSEFGLFDKKGGLSVFSPTFTPVVVSSRVYTYGDQQCEGSYGQDVNSIQVEDKAWISGLEHSAQFRSNIGVFMNIGLEFGASVVFTVEVFDGDGDPAGSGSLVYNEPGLQQVNLDVFDVGLLLDGYAVITCSDPSLRWYAYASVVDETSGDAVFRIAKGHEITK